MRWSSKRPILFCLAGMAIASGLSSPLHAYRLGISPARLRLTVEPGKAIEGAVTINGDFSAPTRIRVTAGDWGLTPTGQLFYPEPGRVGRSLAGWLTVSPPEFTMGPNKTQIVRYRLQAPKEIGGTYWGALFFSNIAMPAGRSSSGVGLRTAARVALLIDATTVRGGISEGRITGMHSGTAQGRIVLRADFANTGNTLLRVKGRFEVKDLKTNRIAAKIPVAEAPVLPGDTRQLSAECPADLAPGAYLGMAILDYGGRNVVAGQRAFKVD